MVKPTVMITLLVVIGHCIFYGLVLKCMRGHKKEATADYATAPSPGVD